MFAEGAFQQAFVPMLADVRSRDGASTTEFVGRMASALFWVLLGVSVLGVIAAPILVWLIASGLARNPDAFELAAVMTRWMFPYILFMSLVALAAGVLNTYRRFAVPAATPVLLNVSFIACALWLAPHLERPIMALAFAVVIGGVLQLAMQLLALRAIGVGIRWSSPLAAFRDPDVRRVGGLMLPALFAVSVAQISIIINTNIASHLATGSVTWLAFADRLMEFPTALLGVALGTVLLPSLSAAFAEQRVEDYSHLLDWGLRLVFLLALPAAVGLGMTAEGIVSVLFQGREFTAFDVRQTALAVVGYSVGLLGLIAVKILAPGFYAQKDIRTPVKIAIVVLIATQLANVGLVPIFAHAGLALSVGLGACANALALFIGLQKKKAVSACGRLDLICRAPRDRARGAGGDLVVGAAAACLVRDAGCAVATSRLARCSHRRRYRRLLRRAVRAGLSDARLRSASRLAGLRARGHLLHALGDVALVAEGEEHLGHQEDGCNEDLKEIVHQRRLLAFEHVPDQLQRPAADEGCGEDDQCRPNAFACNAVRSRPAAPRQTASSPQRAPRRAGSSRSAR